MVEHAFRIFKQCFCELGVKSNLHVTFLLDVIVSCCLLHYTQYIVGAVIRGSGETNIRGAAK